MRSHVCHPRSAQAPAALALLILGLSTAGCSFYPCCNNPDELLPFRDDIPISTPTTGERTLVYEEPGVFAAFHGSSCAESNLAGEEITLRLQEELALPKSLDRATVLLNGFHLRYLDEDHHVQGLGTAIGGIEVANGMLRWEAGGMIADHNADDGYRWCYTYTAVAWSSAQIQATVSHGDTGHAFGSRPWTDATALQPVPGYLYDVSWMGLDEVAVLPRGFGFIWSAEDRHLLQIAYEHDGGEVYVEKDKVYGNGTVAAGGSQVGTGYVTWESTGFLKDNDTRYPQNVVDLATGLGGRDVGLISPPFSVVPREDAGPGCGSLSSGEPRMEERMVLAVPYAFAIPVLTGWDLAYVCDDEHVASVGAWIPTWKWAPGATAAGGTLTYTVATHLADKDGLPDFYDRTQVKILGLRKINPMPPPPR
jgi:hypothetical protein